MTTFVFKILDNFLFGFTLKLHNNLFFFAFSDSTIMISDGDYKYASTEIITGPGYGNSEIESTFVDESSNRRKRGLVQVQ